MSEMAVETTVPHHSVTFLEWLCGDIEVPCDFSTEDMCPDEPARWVLHRVPCCEAKANAALACDTCKEHRLMDHFSLECDSCGAIFEHAPDAYFLIEPLNKKGAK